MMDCRYDGIWGLLWVVKDDQLHKIEVRREEGEGGMEVEEEEEEEEEVVEEKIVSTNGWELLKWLIDLWEKDELETQSSNPDEREFIDTQL